MDKAALSAAIAAARDGTPELVLKNARVVNVFTGEILPGDIAVGGGLILGVGQYSAPEEIDLHGAYACPGLIDAHVHIESTMAAPPAFAQAVLRMGTTTVVADPHEITNVLGAAGLQYMLDASRDVGVNIHFALPSCVPCTAFECNGANFTARDMRPFLANPRVAALGEVMDDPAVIQAQPEMLDKLLLFQGRMIDGHAPRLSGRDLNAYCLAGVQTDHECTTFDEVQEKLRAGMFVHIRVGSAANDVEGILTGLARSGMALDRVLLCTDDKHLGDILSQGHINHIVALAIRCGIPPVDAVRMATLNAAVAYRLPRTGAIAPGYRADLVVTEDLAAFRPSLVLSGGRRAEDIPLASYPVPAEMTRSVHLAPLREADFDLTVTPNTPAIQLIPGQLVTKLVRTDTGDGFNRLAVIERHKASGSMALGLLKGLSIHDGAIASTVAHDSHNLIIAGDNSADMLLAARTLEACGGGYAVVSRGQVLAQLPLPIAGLMSSAPLEELLADQRALHAAACRIGVPEEVEPFTNLSFLALPVIPEVRITNLGMFDAVNFRFF